MRLETERLLLRPFEARDIEALVGLWTDPEVTRFLGGPRNHEELYVAFEEDAAGPSSDPYDLWPVEERATGVVIGHCGLLDKEVEGREEIELIYVFVKSVWGRGYATEIGLALRDHAFEEMGLSRLISLIEPGNVASDRVAQKVGMRMEKEIVRPGSAVRRIYAVAKPDVPT